MNKNEYVVKLKEASSDAMDLLFAECERCECYYSSIRFCNRDVGECCVLGLAIRIETLIKGDDNIE